MDNRMIFTIYISIIACIFFTIMIVLGQQSAPRIASETCHVVTTTQNTAQASRIETCEVIKEYAKK